VDRQRHALFPATLQRQQLADSLARNLGRLGLKRRPKQLPTLPAFIAEHDAQKHEG
jgi:hypothetical protein